jgi:hypothetical protein
LPKPSQIYQIEITLRDSRPPVWRRIQVRDDITLAELHKVLQAVMGWTDMHLQQFVIRDKYYGIPDEEEESGFSRSAIHSQSWVSVFLPGTVLMRCAS